MSAQIVDCGDFDGIRDAADLLRAGGVVLAQTDTNYGLFCNPFSEHACRRLYKMKQRDGKKPLSLFVSCPRDWLRWACRPENVDVDAVADRFWPGPLNLVMRKRQVVPDWVTSGMDTVAIVHNVSVVVNVLSVYAGLPLAATSANISGTMDEGLVTFDLAFDHVGDMVEVAIRGDQESAFTMSSTIVGLAGEPRILRQGDLSADELRKVIPEIRA